MCCPMTKRPLDTRLSILIIIVCSIFILTILFYFSKNLEKPCDVDDLWISIKLENNKSFIVSNIYRHPSSGIDTFKEN